MGLVWWSLLVAEVMLGGVQTADGIQDVSFDEMEGYRWLTGFPLGGTLGTLWVSGGLEGIEDKGQDRDEDLIVGSVDMGMSSGSKHY